MKRHLLVLLTLALLAVGCSSSDDSSTSSTTASTTSADETTTTTEAEGEGVTDVVDPYDGYTSDVYGDDANWICRPDLSDDECRALDVTAIASDGTRTVEEREPAADPPIDCFYVYPTVSSDPGAIADLDWTPTDAEAATVRAQAAQYARSCRVFAPVYRQVTLAGLGTATPEERAMAYADVLDAWKTYISQWNDGRGVILIGHSQGTGHLTRLIAEEIDLQPVLRDRLVAAHLFGGTISGRMFDTIAPCTSADETGCLVFWSSYPAVSPPVPEAIFSRTVGYDPSLCVDVTDLLGEERSSPVAPVDAPLVGGVRGTEGIETPFVSLPDALSLSCESTADHDYLAVGLPDPSEGDARPLDQLTVETLGPTWGLHLFDVTIAMDDLVELARRQADAYSG